MCGIVGFNWEDGKKIKTLAGLLQHRGPEQEGFHVADGFLDVHRCGLCCNDDFKRLIYNLQSMLENNRYVEYGSNARGYVERHHDIKKAGPGNTLGVFRARIAGECRIICEICQ